MSKNAMTLKVDDKGLVKMGSLEDMMAFASHLLASKILPTSYQTPEKVVAAMQLAAELGLKPGIKALSRIANINGTPNLFAEGPLAVVQASGQLEDFDGYHVDDKGERICFGNKNLKAKPWGYVFRAKRREQPTWYEESYTLDQAKNAGLGNVWNKHPEDMLKWRTIGKVLKTMFADVLAGAPIAEYDNDTYVGKDGVEGGRAAVESDLNDRFKEQPKDAAPVAIETDVAPHGSQFGDFEVRIGSYAGKKLKDIPLDEVLKLAASAKTYSDTLMAPLDNPDGVDVERISATKAMAMEIHNKATAWFESQKGF